MKPYERLLDHNIKPSVQRIAIMQYLMEYPVHPSADDIYTALSPSMPTLSKTTVYNTLKNKISVSASNPNIDSLKISFLPQMTR